MTKQIKAVTFDLWDTVIIDDSDEPKRKKMGLLSKPEERRNLIYQALQKHENYSSISKKIIDSAYDVADAAFREVWYGQNVTWNVETRLSVILKGLKCLLPSDELSELVRLHEEMELDVQPDLAPGIVDAIKELSGQYKLGVISDTIFSSGRVLRELLVRNNIAQYFSAFVFSDEAGCSKPNPSLFKQSAAGLGVEPNEIVHIGDREQKDIDGPHQVGAKGIYTTVVLDRGPCESADAVCDDYSQLVNIVNKLS